MEGMSDDARRKRQTERKLERSRRREQQEIIREAVAAAETETGHVSFPDRDTNRVQIVLSEGRMGVDVPNALESTVTPSNTNYCVVRYEDFGPDAKLVEFER